MKGDLSMSREPERLTSLKESDDIDAKRSKNLLEIS